MSGEWEIETKVEPSGAGVAAVYLGFKEAATGRIVQMTSACHSLQDLSREVNAIKSELDAALDQAREQLEAARCGGAGAEKLEPDAIWKKMQSLPTEKEMFDYFNSLGEADRQRVADHILSHANMFKGRGPVFSEHYDHSVHKLE